MIISNGKPHDLIIYHPIQKQLYDIFIENGFNVSSYDFIKYDKTDFILNNSIRLCCESKSNGVHIKLSYLNSYPLFDIYDSEINLPKTNIKYNANLSDSNIKFFDIIKDYIKKYNEFLLLVEKSEKIDYKKIEEFLNFCFDTELIKCSFWFNPAYIHNKNSIKFHIHPKDNAPASGALFLITEDKKIELYWNKSTDTRNYGTQETIETVFKNVKFSKGTKGMKEKIYAIEMLESKIESFPTHIDTCQELINLIELKKEAKKLTENLFK